MRIKNIQDTNFQDYRKTSMLIATCYCDGKCWKERGLNASDCQNEELLAEPIVEVSNDEIIQRYLSNPLSEAIIFGGLEPLLQYNELVEFLSTLRVEYGCYDDVVIYTGYEPGERAAELDVLKQYGPLVVKWGRYLPDSTSKYDDVLGISLASANQHAERYDIK